MKQKSMVALLNAEKGLFYIGKNKSDYSATAIASITEAEATQFAEMFKAKVVGVTNVYALVATDIYAVADVVANRIRDGIRVAAGLPGTLPVAEAVAA